MCRLIRTIIAAAVLSLGIAGGPGLGESATAGPGDTAAVVAEGGMGPNLTAR
jgi:hypothetical protein